MSGFDVVRRMKAIGLSYRVVFLTVHDDRDWLRKGSALGASEFVVKPRMATDLPTAIRQAFLRRQFISPSPALSDDRGRQ